MNIQRILCGFCFALAASFANGQQPEGRGGIDPATLTEQQIAGVQVPQVLYRLGDAYRKSGDDQRMMWTLKRLYQLQPNASGIAHALAVAYAKLGDKSAAYDTLLKMHQQGFGLDLADKPEFEKIGDTELWRYLVENLKANLAPFGEGKVAFTLPGGDTLNEALAYDAKRKRMLVGSVRDGTIQIVDDAGKLKPFIEPDAENGLWSVYAMAVAPDEDALYVASTSSVLFRKFDQSDFGKAGLFKFDLGTGRLAARYLLPEDSQPQTLSSVAVGKGGLVFVADGIRNIIYRLDGGELKPMVANPRLTSIRGMAVSADGGTLYFADYTMGLLGVDLAAGKGFDLQYDPVKLFVGGVDGLYWYDNALVLIQNGMTPKRVMRLILSDDGRSVVRAMPLDAGKPEFELPTYGMIRDDGLYFVANSQKNRYDGYGSPKDESKLEPVKIYRSDLRFAWDSGDAMAPAKAPVVSKSKPGGGVFSNVVGGSNSINGN